MATITIAKDKRDGSEHSIREMKVLKNHSQTKFETLKANLVCEECRIPQMIPRLGEVTEHHFAKAPKQDHHFDCYYYGDEYTQKEIDYMVEYIADNKPSQNQVASAFAQIQKYLIRDESELNTVANEPAGKRKRLSRSSVSNDEHQNSLKSKYIPRKKLTKEISDEDLGIWKIYYGEVGVRHHTSNDKFENYFVHALLGEKQYPYRLSMGISTKITSYFDDQTKNILDKIKEKQRKVNLMVLGKVAQHGQYNNITIFDTRLISISPTD